MFLEGHVMKVDVLTCKIYVHVNHTMKVDIVVLIVVLHVLGVTYAKQLLQRFTCN